MRKSEIIVTGDGSTSIYLPELDETYHSRHGAVQESQHVFIEQGFKKLLEHRPTQISVLEIGMGTGLNVWLTAVEALKAGIPVNMITLEPFPLEPGVIEQLNYTESYSSPHSEYFRQIHSVEWEVPAVIHPDFTLMKTKTSIQDFHTSAQFDLIYYDAFAPAKQKEIWDVSLIRKVSKWCNSDAVFVTYCAMGQLKRDLAGSGFEVETLPGPPGKREMVRGLRR
jgi:tRNA U34 5-methylaminomethyl-2-thiouridine-forming methyltransferase MnmC